MSWRLRATEVSGLSYLMIKWCLSTVSSEDLGQFYQHHHYVLGNLNAHILSMHVNMMLTQKTFHCLLLNTDHNRSLPDLIWKRSHPMSPIFASTTNWSRQGYLTFLCLSIYTSNMRMLKQMASKWWFKVGSLPDTEVFFIPGSPQRLGFHSEY